MFRGWALQVTYVVVSKNHGTRLFPASEAGSLKGNVLPGTVVDTQLVAPLRYEFCINSHAGIQV
jgi:eukaryotic translation initiation factor 2C